MTDFTPTELMVTASARALAGKRIVFVGVGLPNIACNLARRTVAPDLELVYESGIFGAHPARQPLSIGDPTLVSGATSACSMVDLFMNYLQGGLIEAAFLGAAQIDRFGNLNTTVIGNYNRPKVRLPGSGGACEIALMAKEILIIMRLSRRAFVDKIDFVTSPGHLTGGSARAGLGSYGQGPATVITNKCVFTFDQTTKEMTLASLHPGVTVDQVQAEMGWNVAVSPNLETTPPPSAKDLHILREDLGGVR